MSTSSRQIGPYRILSLLGKGGMGEVYLAEDPRLGRKIAVKLLGTAFTRDEDRLGRFEQEARAASALNHPNILTIFDIGEADGAHFIATEYIEGDTLRCRIPQAGMTLRETLDVAVQVAGALAAAHVRGIVHRDIKPENIMLRRDGYIKVLDFGLAKLVELAAPGSDTSAPTVARAATDPGRVVGTAQYMSPEQARGLKVDERTDIFSLGAVLYEMATGRPAFTGATATDIMASVLNKEPPSLARAAPEAPPELERIVTKALAKDREERYQNVKDLLIDLKRLKQRGEIDSEIERSRSSEAPVAARTSGVEPVRAVSSAEYLLTGVKRHKTAVLAVLGVAIAAAAAGAYFLGRSAPIRSIAVLPFVNDTGDPNSEYLSDGISESLINGLSQLPRLTVMSRNSVFRYKGKDADAQQAGKTLNVDAVLTGRVSKRGDGLSISTELVDTRDNSHVWGEQYNRSLAALMDVQEEIARDVSEKLRMRISGEQQKRMAIRATRDPEAYQHYLRGRYQYNRYSDTAIDFFQQAVAKDPNFAEAYTGLADTYVMFADYQFPSNEAGPRAKEAARRALAINDGLAEAHNALGTIYALYEWNWAAAENEFRRALSLNPNYALAHDQYGWMLTAVGRLNEAQEHFNRAAEMEPTAVAFAMDASLPTFANRQFDRSIPLIRKALSLDPAVPIAHLVLGIQLAASGQTAEGIAEAGKARALDDRPFNSGFVAHAYGQGGQSEKARQIVAELQHSPKFVPSIAMFYSWLGAGDVQQALNWLEKACDEHSPTLPFAAIDSSLGAVRSDPRFQAVLRRMNLTR
jgi:serine/threonine protein kinase